MHPKPQRQLPDPHWKLIPYPQVFQEKHGFSPNLSILDLLFCTGPEALSVLESSYTSTI
ncbi:MAG: WbqC family protein [Saprospiraceae bacterium]|nr:WbqC family protein [Saprospiraceae bacterium]